MTVYLLVGHTAQEPGSLFWCHAVMSLQFTHVRYFTCSGRGTLQSWWLIVRSLVFISLDTELTDDKDIQRQLQYQYCAANKLWASFSRCSNAVKNVLFRSFCTPMYASQLWRNFISRACRDCGWHIILVAELYTTCPGERVLVATKFNVTLLPLRLCYVNTSTCFSKDAENLTMYGYVLWYSQIVCTRHYSLNTIIAFYSVIEWSNFALSVWSMACQATTLAHFT